MILRLSFLTTLLGLASFFFVACAPSGKSSGRSAQSPVHILEGVPSDIHGAAAQDVLLRCAKGHQCPEGIALVVSRNPGSLSQCTGFLIGPDLLMTNSHCLMREIRRAGSSCSNYLFATLPKTGTFPQEKIFCDRVLEASNIGKNDADYDGSHPDWAILKLKRPTKRAYFRLSNDGLPDRLTLTAYTIDPQSKTHLEGVIQEKTCTSVLGSSLFRNYFQEFAEVGAFKGCKIIPGNSGSPAIDASGIVRAVVHGTVLPKKRKIESTGQVVNLESMAAMTNIACVSFPRGTGIHIDKNPACGTEANQAALNREFNQKADGIIRDNLRSIAVKAGLERAVYFTFAASDNSSNATYSPRVHCYRKGIREGEFVYEKPVWRVMETVNSDYTSQLAVIEKSKSNVHLRIEMDEERPRFFERSERDREVELQVGRCRD